MTSHWIRAIGLSVVLLLVPFVGSSLACSCGPSGPPCQAAWTGDVVFAGKVRAIEPIDGDPGPVEFRPKRVILEIERGYIDAPSSGMVEVRTAGSGPQCGYGFTVGERYLVYAGRQPSGELITGICSRTRRMAEAGEDLEYLSSLPPKGTGGRVYGRVNEWGRDPAEERGVDYGPLAGLTVSVQTPTTLVDVVTDARGRFEVPNLPVGKATITVAAPFGFDARYLTREFEIRDLRGCSAQDFTLSLRATASGIVVDASGRPLAGVRVDAVAAELAGFAPPPHQQPATTNQRGEFEFDRLPPGTYVFGVNLTKRPGSMPSGASVFLPGVAAARDAAVIELKAGDERAVGVLRLPER